MKRTPNTRAPRGRKWAAASPKLARLSLLALLLGARCAVAAAQPSTPELVLQTGHTFPVNVAVFNPEGTLVASAGMDNSVKLWDVMTGRELRSLYGHAKEVKLLAFRPDGMRFASGGDDSVKIWEVESGKLLHEFKLAASLRGLDFSPDGKNLATAEGGKIRLRDLETGGEPRLLDAATPINDIAFSGDGKWLAVGGLGVVKVFDAATGAEARAWAAHPRRRVASLAFSQNGRWLATGGGDRTARVWEFETGREVGAFVGPHREVTSVAFSPDGKSLATASRSNRVCIIWDVETGKAWCRALLHRKAVKSAAFHPNGRWLLTASEDRVVTLWDAEAAKLLRPYHGFINESRSVEFSGDGRWLVVGNSDGTVRWWDLLQGKVSRTLQSGQKAVRDVAFNEDSRLLAAVGSDGRARIYEVSTGRELKVLSGHTGPATCVAFSRDGRRAATGSEDGTVRVWDVETGRAVKTFPARERLQVRSISFSGDGHWLASAAWRLHGGTALVLWDLESGEQTHAWSGTEREGHFTAVAFSPDSKILAASHGRRTRLIDPRSRQDVGQLEDGDFPTSLRFSRDGRWLAAVDAADRSVQVWDLEAGRHRTFRGYAGMVLDAALSPKADLLASVGVDGGMRLWDTASGRQLLQLATVSGGRGWVAATGNGLFDATADVMQHGGWRVDATNGVASLDTFYNDFYHPGLVLDVLNGDLPAVSLDIAATLQLPGLRTMLRQRLAHVVTDGTKTFVCFKDEPTMLNISLLSDGQPLSVGGFDFVPSDPICRYRKEVLMPVAQLDIINNALARGPARARSSAGDAAEPGVKTETSAATLHVLTVAISQYPPRSAAKPLPFSVTGARAVEEFFSEQKRNGAAPFAGVRVWPHLHDAAATRDAIQDRLARMAEEVAEGDVVFLFFSGHGTVPAGQEMFYFIPADGLGPDPEDRRSTGLNTAMLADALRNLPARRVVLVIDACQSGGAVESLAKVGEVKSMIETQRLRTREQSKSARAEVGIHIIAAAAPLQYALQPKSLGNGALVTALLEALNGGSGEGTISIADLIEHVKRRTPEISKEFTGANAPIVQTPLIVSSGVDFAIANRKP